MIKRGSFLIFLSIILNTAIGHENHRLEVGDILLQPLDCWSCDLIEAEENSIYSHIGIYIGSDQVLEAYGKVQIVSLKKFLSKTESGQTVKARRPIEKFSKALVKQYAQRVDGYPYDAKFLWRNFRGDKEPLYCSELVFKALKSAGLIGRLAPKKMHFDINTHLWERFFKGPPPHGQLGISPEDFNQSEDFYDVFEL